MEFGLTVEQLTERLAVLFRRFRSTPGLPAAATGTRVADRVDP
jgi:hypothetical protein